MLPKIPTQADQNVNHPTVFISFDLDHDQDLYDLLIEQSSRGRLGFRVSGRSERRSLQDAEFSGVRREIRKADQVIVLCGEHTSGSAGVFAELQIAREEKKPYLLIWGRRECMCTKPEGAKSGEGMYGWTQPILREQIALASREVAAAAQASTMSRAARS